jgi:hypothetical protein
MNECRSACVAQRPSLAGLNTRAAALLGDCISNLSCTALYSGATAWNEAMNACWSEAEMSIEPTAKVRSFCLTISQKRFECGSWWSSTEGCELFYVLKTDDIIDWVTACGASATCEELETCIDSTL